MKLIPYLFFDGTCAEAIAFYAEVFGGTVESISEEQKNRVMHAHMDAKPFSL
jgi:uncharacterized glyoxalase superfamily protein PhnB